MKSLKFFLFATAIVLFSHSSLATTKVVTVHFEKDKYVLDAASMNMLNALSKAHLFYLMGHTDSDGDIAYNQSLSQKRVNAVATYLKSKNYIEKNKMVLDYFGESKPLNNNIDETEKAKNRRVEIYYNDNPLLAYTTPTQLHFIYSTHDTTIFLNNGTKIYIPAHTFSADKTRLEVKEYTDVKSILSAGLNTHSDRKMLETSGMLYMEAMDENFNQISPSKEIAITFKNNGTNHNDFKYFEGKFNPQLEMNWVTSNSTPTYNPQLLQSYTVSALLYVGNNIIGEQLPKLEKLTTDSNFIKYINIPCFTGTKAILDITTDGKLKQVVTNIKDKNCDCEKTMQQYITKYFNTQYNTDRNALYYSELIPTTIEFSLLNSKGKLDTTTIAPLPKNNVEYQNLFCVKEAKKIKQEEEMARIKWQKDIIENNRIQDSIYNAELAIENARIKAEQKLLNEQNKKNEVFNSFYKELTIKVNKLGWVNCDRFTNRTTQSFVYKQPDTYLTVIVKKPNAILSGYIDNGKVIYTLPDNENVTLVYTKYQGDKILFDIQNTNTKNLNLNNMQLKEISSENLNAELAKLKFN